MQNVPRSRKLVRLAVRLVDALEGADQRPSVEIPHVAWHRWSRMCERLKLAEARGWKSAAEELHSDIRWQARSLAQAVQSHVGGRQSPAGRNATLREVYDDLVALEEEFEGFQFNLRDETLSVVTGPIVLEDVHLGRFEIHLRYGDLDRDHSYDVVSLDADEDVEYTHPHVANEVLCEGDGAEPIAQALTQGRFLDFFVLVRQVLETYNPSSPHAPLSRWRSETCSDCGGSYRGDTLVSCRCGALECDDCVITCDDCSRVCCSSCRRRCPSCDDTVCEQCQSACDSCEANHCEDCLTDGLCPSGQESPNEENEPDDNLLPATTEEAQTTETPVVDPVQSACLGETLVPA
jgi:hypothetical protein